MWFFLENKFQNSNPVKSSRPVNKTVGEQKLRGFIIFNCDVENNDMIRKDGDLVADSSELSLKLSTLLESETLFNGDTIYLDFETDN